MELDCHVEEGSVNGDVLFSTIQKLLVPHMMPYNGTNPHSVIELDNASIHHIDGVVEMLHSLGTLVLFFPPTLRIIILSRKHFLNSNLKSKSTNWTWKCKL